MIHGAFNRWYTIAVFSELRMLDVSVNPSFTNKSLQAITPLNLPHIIYLVVDKCKNVS